MKYRKFGSISTHRIQVPVEYKYPRIPYYEVLENISTHSNIGTPQIEVHLYLPFKNKRLSEEDPTKS